VRKMLHPATCSALIVALALTIAPVHARADEIGTDPDKFSWEQFWDSVACAAGIATIETPAGIATAVVACGRMISRYAT
jgi:hypothetical protein